MSGWYPGNRGVQKYIHRKFRQDVSAGTASNEYDPLNRFPYLCAFKSGVNDYSE